MCDTCPAHIPGPGEVAGGLLSLAASKTGRRVTFHVVFWGFCIPMLPFALWDLFGWWCIALAVVLAVGSAAGIRVVRAAGQSRRVLLVTPDTMRAALPAPRAAVLPRNLSISRGRRALPAPAKALPSAEPITGRVVTVPVQRAARP